jgi:hypothetical protein
MRQIHENNLIYSKSDCQPQTILFLRACYLLNATPSRTKKLKYETTMSFTADFGCIFNLT